MPRIPSAAAARQVKPWGAEHTAFWRSAIIGVIGFLTLVDLFATQAILPSLAKAYAVTPAAIGFAVNASTMGMAVGLPRGGAHQPASQSPSRHLGQPGPACRADVVAGRRAGPRHLHRAAHRAGRLHGDGLHPHAGVSRRALQRGGYGRRARRLHHRVVASNLVGRLVSASVADLLGLAANFYLFAALNLAGAALVYLHLDRMRRWRLRRRSALAAASWAQHFAQSGAARRLRHRLLHPVRIHRHLHLCELRAGAGRRIAISPMSLGFVYLVFFPSMFSRRPPARRRCVSERGRRCGAG